MARILILPSALAELREVEPLSARRRVVARLSALERPPAEDALAAGGRYRHQVAGWRVLYRRRDDGSLVITAVGRQPMF